MVAFLSARVGWWVMVGIPVSFMLALALFYAVFGYGVSIIALIGFIMALGIVVDDAIVVGEDAVTQFESGKSPADAAVAGAQRMWVPVVTSSMTTNLHCRINAAVLLCADTLHIESSLIGIGSLKREWIVRPFGSRVAAIPLVAVASATSPSARTVAITASNRNVLPVPA